MFAAELVQGGKRLQLATEQNQIEKMGCGQSFKDGCQKAVQRQVNVRFQLDVFQEQPPGISKLFPYAAQCTSSAETERWHFEPSSSSSPW
jgi:hypothetical protein